MLNLANINKPLQASEPLTFDEVMKNLTTATTMGQAGGPTPG